MKDTKKIPINYELDFNHSKTRQLEEQLLSGEITFEEWEMALQEDFEDKLSKL